MNNQRVSDKIIRIVAATTLALLLATLWSSFGESASASFVSPTNPVQVCPICAIKSVQTAINDAAYQTVIQVAEGIYAERLVLTKSVRLEGGWNTDFTARDVLNWRTVLDGQGAGTVISIANASPVIDGFWITGGQAVQGGGVWMTDARPVFSNNVMTGNITILGATGYGGAIYAQGKSTELILDANRMFFNTATQGGGVFLSDISEITITNNVFANNFASVGNAVYLQGVGQARVINNTLVGDGRSSGLVIGNSSFTLVNNIIVSHTVGVEYKGSVDSMTILYPPIRNLFYANQEDCIGEYSDVICSNGLMSEPQLTADYHLRLTSPAIDAGSRSMMPPTDVDGESRPRGEVDIGADEAGMRIQVPVVFHEAVGKLPTCPFAISIWPRQVVPQQAPDARRVGACWARINIYWDEIEPERTEPRTFNWETADAVIRGAVNAGLRPIVTIGANPRWAAETYGGPTYNVNEILGFLTALAERYDRDGVMDAPGAPYVQIWEIYNEPDNYSPDIAALRGFGNWGLRGEAYAQFLGQARVALRLGNPNALVAMGGLAHEYAPGIFDLDFPHKILAYARDHPGEVLFDFFNIHYFPVYESAYSGWGWGISGKTNYFREMMSFYTLKFPILVTEMGYWSSSTEPPPWEGSHEEQTRLVVLEYVRSIATNIYASFWLLVNDLPASHGAERGLFDIDGTPKPSANAYQTLVDQLGEMYFERSLSASELGNTAAEGYLFRSVKDGHRLYVVWTNDHSEGRLRVQSPAILVSDRISSELPMTPVLPYFDPYMVQDGDDGKVDGVIWTTFGWNPIYIEAITPPVRSKYAPYRKPLQVCIPK